MPGLEPVLRELSVAVDGPDDGRAGVPEAGRGERDDGGVGLPFPVGVEDAPLDDGGANQLEADPRGGRRDPPLQHLRKPAELRGAQEVALHVEPGDHERPVGEALRLAGGDQIVRAAHGVDRHPSDRLARRADDAAVNRRLGRQTKVVQRRPGPIDVQVGDLGGQPGVAHPDRVGPGPGAQADAEAAVLARDLVEDGRPLEPDADLRPLDAAAGLVGDPPLHEGLGAIGGVAAKDLPPELLLGGEQAARHRSPRHRALGRQPRAEVDAVARILGIAERRRDGVGLDQRRRRSAAPLAPDAPLGTLDAADIARVDDGRRRVGRRRPPPRSTAGRLRRRHRQQHAERDPLRDSSFRHRCSPCRSMRRFTQERS